MSPGNPTGQLPVPQQVFPQPTPFQPIIGRATMSDGQEAVMINFYTITGSTMLFLNPEGAMQLANEIIANARSVSSGLILPPGVNMAPPASPQPQETEGDKTHD